MLVRASCSWLAVAGLLTTFAPAATLRVGPGDGADFVDIQAALDAAEDGDTVLVAPGEYVVEEALSFNRSRHDIDPLPPAKDLVLRSEAGPSATTIRRVPPAGGECCPHGAVRFDDGESSASVLSGFTIRGTDGLTGAGIYCGGYFGGRAPASPTIEDCILTGSYHDGEGPGGGLMSYGGDPTIIGCTVIGNISGWDDDTAGGLSFHGGSATVVGCRIEGNSLRAGSGGGVACDGADDVTIADTVIIGNTASWGGGIVCQRSRNLELTNCIIAGNSAESAPALGVSDGSVTLIHCTIAGNACTGSSSAAIDAGYSSVRMVNCLVRDNAPRSLDVSREATADASYCSIEADEAFPGVGNDTLDPLFVDPGLFDHSRFVTVTAGGTDFVLPDFIVERPDFRLLPESPAIDSGTLEGAPAADIAGTPRPWGGGVDRGAYEMEGVPIPERFRRGDANHDGGVDIADAVSILRHLFLGDAAPSCADSADADDSGTIEITDPIRVLDHLFLGGSAPPAPYPDCGPDPTSDALECSGTSGCP